PVRRGLDPDNVQRVCISDPQAAALTDSVMMKPRVRSHYLSLAADNLARVRQPISLFFGLEISIDEGGVVAVGNKTDLLRFFLFRNREIVTAGCLTRIGL